MPKLCLRPGCVEQVASRWARLCGACRRANYFDPVCRRCNLARGPAVDSAARDTSLIQPTRRPAKPQAGKGV